MPSPIYGTCQALCIAHVTTRHHPLVTALEHASAAELGSVPSARMRAQLRLSGDGEAKSQWHTRTVSVKQPTRFSASGTHAPFIFKQPARFSGNAHLQVRAEYLVNSMKPSPLRDVLKKCLEDPAFAARRHPLSACVDQHEP